MEDLFGQIECRSSSDSIVMRILRSAMDKTHEKLQFKDGPIEFLHERTLFYKLAAILVEGGLNIVQEETDVLEGGGNEILSDLLEIRQWLKGRIQDMNQLIVDKDGELAERLETEAKLWQALDQKDQELVYLHEKIEPGRMKNDEFHDGAAEGDISKLKSSVDQQMLNIKQKLEDERKILISERRARRSRISSPNLSFDFLDKERSGSLVVKEDESFDNVKPQSELSRLNQNVLIKRMSSDIDILKETLDLAFGRMQRAEVLPLEKQWRWTIEKDIETILVKGFIRDLQRSFDVQVEKKVGLLKDNCLEFMDEMRALFYELKDSIGRNDAREEDLPGVRRTTSEPFSCTENLLEEDDDDDEVKGSHLVAKMIKNHESIICKQQQQDTRLTKERSSVVKKEKGNNSQERRIQDAITRMDNFTGNERKIPDNETKADRNLTTAERSEVDSDEKQEEERDGLCLQMSMLEDIYMLLFHSMMKDVSSVLCCKDNEGLFSDDHINNGKERNSVDESEGSTSTQIQLRYLESTIREDLYVVFFSETYKQWKEIYIKEKTTQISSPDRTKCLPRGAEIPTDEESIGSLLKEDIYMVFLRELAESWKSEMVQCSIRESVHQFVVVEAVKDMAESRLLKQISFQERTPRSRRLYADNSREGTPRSRKLETDGDEGLIEKLDSLLKCFEAEEDLMLKASSIIKEHTAINNLVILNCEELDERDAIEWLITDDESTFSSVSEKLERALQQLYTSKELLVELEQTLDVSTDDFGEDIEHENSNGDDDDDQGGHNVLAIIMQFQIMFNNVEQLLLENLEAKSLRVEVLKRQVDALIQPMSSIRTRKLVYKKAFVSRCHNLKLAENEVDVLGDQVESLLYLLERIYALLNRNATVLSRYFEVYDILKLIKLELNGRSCKP
ncbi:hypothetical protein ACS0TY_009357 [Phlomoides rotata]